MWEDEEAANPLSRGQTIARSPKEIWEHGYSEIVLSLSLSLSLIQYAYRYIYIYIDGNNTGVRVSTARETTELETKEMNK